MDRGAWWATVCGVAKSQTQLSDWAWTHMSVEAYKSVLPTPRAHPANHCAGGWITGSLFPTKKREKLLWGPHCHRHNDAFFLQQVTFFLTKLPSFLLGLQEGGPIAGHIIPELEESERSPNSISHNQTKSLRVGDRDGLIRNPQLVL